MSDDLAVTAGRSAGMQKATVVASDEHLGALVSFAGNEEATCWCPLLEPMDGHRLRLQVGDTVLVWCDPDSELTVITGRIARSSQRGGAAVADELVIEARTSLTLRVGDGSITIREDGRILIRGKDLVSHAKRTNRIRGGSVQIN